LLHYSIQVRPAGDPLVGDGVQPWQGRECLHPKRWPACAPRPRTHSAAAMRALPAGWTSSIRTAPCPVVISKPSSVCCTAPGAPRPSTTLAPNSLISRPSSAVHRSEEHTSELQSRENLVCPLLLDKKNM